MLRWYVVVLLHGILLTPAFACKCAPPPPPPPGAPNVPPKTELQLIRDKFASADFVFEGEVESVSGKPSHDVDGELEILVRTRMRVLRMYKGAPRAVLEFAGHLSSCDVTFEPGERYLLYASDGAYGGLSTRVCGSRYLLFEEAAADLRFLRGEQQVDDAPTLNGKQLPRESAAICGTVIGQPDGERPVYVYAWATDSSEAKPAGSDRVGEDGTFSIQLRPGKYQLSAASLEETPLIDLLGSQVFEQLLASEIPDPSARLQFMEERWVSVFGSSLRLQDSPVVGVKADDESCGHVLFLRRTTVVRLAGRVITTDGSRVPEPLRILVVSRSGNAFPYARQVPVERDGAFRITLPEGLYRFRAEAGGESWREWSFDFADHEIDRDREDLIITIRRAR